MRIFHWNTSPTSYNVHPLGHITCHYGDVIMGTIASQITSLTIVYSTVYSGADQRKHQSSTGTGEFPAQMASNTENVSIWWRHHALTAKGAGLDAYFFTNLGVGQPSNNMDLSETKIYLGSIIYVFFAMRKSRRTLIINIFILISRFTVFKEPCHVINHWCSSLEVALFISVHFDVTGIRHIFQRI